MGMARVYNDNIHPFTQMFEDEKVMIPAKGFVIMDFDKAHQFKSSYFPMVKDGGGSQDPKSYKMIRVVPIDPNIVIPEFICQYDGKKFGNQEDLDHYIEQNYAEKILDEKEKEKRLKNKASNKVA